ncbi:hypothetical protein BVC80_8755g17 [Macleaya cordata]|uniref:Uncharacterized protein n=1 Tax=Macleaya cordata TaxID=56857 RepID=A0A200PXN9_MACCD|nr:hypothetical protein BVC80_8755g17 [Macleaya cordata]
MPEKGLKSVSHYNLWPNAWFYMRFPVLLMAVFLGMLIIWSIDGFSIKAWRNRQSYDLLRTLHSPINLTGSTHLEPILHRNVTFITDKDLLNSTKSQPQSQSQSQSESPKRLISNLGWISVELEQNLTSNLLTRWLSGEPCHDCRTSDIKIPSLDDQKSVELSTGDIHHFVFYALDESGNRRLLGGDYFEADLSGELWKSRPPIKDLGNGSYSLSIQVHQDFGGEFNLTIILLYRRYEGLRFTPVKFVLQKELRQIPIKFYKSSTKLPELQICKKSDFSREIWSGRWTRHGKNDQCEISEDGRYRCLNSDFPCQNPWCFGSLGSLESNGWVYSTHCSFQIFSQNSAWECLKNRWIFFWGDSNHVDSIRNLLNFVLGLPEIKSVPRRFDMNFTNPSNPSQSVRITSIFNGHWNDTMNYEGLNSLNNTEYQNLLKNYFSEETVPDTMIMNSGLHDGIRWRNIRRFSKGADLAARFWKEVLESVKGRNLKVPRFLYRTTVATGGYARGLGFNPQKMEVYNEVVLDKLREYGILSGVIDDFDMTFPWHYDNRCNDGVHYGRAPAKAKWRDGEIGHQYFVDLMLGHVILNALCAG